MEMAGQVTIAALIMVYASAAILILRMVIKKVGRSARNNEARARLKAIQEALARGETIIVAGP